ncbi:MAG: sugar phosphate isomerase/epimerase family protein [Candidatus Zhuqueibacterota bacterium]
MLKIAYSTLPCAGWPPEEMIEYCRKYGFAGIELRESDESWASVMLTSQARDRIRKLFEQNGIRITNIGSSVCILGNDSEDRVQKMKLLLANIGLAADLKACGVRIFLGNFINRHSDQKERIDHDRIVEFIQQACQLAQNFDIEIWVETHNEYGTGQALHQLFKDVDRKNCGAIWDVMHPLEDQEAPEETLEWLGSHCRHVHIKDGRPFADQELHRWEYTRLGEGIIPNEEIIKLLLNDHYEGFFSLEWESKWRPELQFKGAEAEIILPSYANYMKKIASRISQNPPIE